MSSSIFAHSIPEFYGEKKRAQGTIQAVRYSACLKIDRSQGRFHQYQTSGNEHYLQLYCCALTTIITEKKAPL